MNSKAGNFFIHESSYIDPNVSIGENTKIWHFSHIMSGANIGANCNIGQNVMIGTDVVIGNNCKIQNNVSIYQGVTLEADVFCGPSIVFTNVLTPRCGISRKNEFLQTKVRKGVTIGANATIVCGNEIGQYAFIGAGSVITKSVAKQALVVGNPGKQIGWMCVCGERLPELFECSRCHKKYTLIHNGKEIREV